MAFNFGQPPTNLGAILGGLGTGQGGGGLMQLLNLLFQGGAGRQALMPGITGGRTMAGVRRPQPIIPGAVEIEGPGGKGGIPGGPTTIDPIANLLGGGAVPGRPDLTRPVIGPDVITDQNAPFRRPTRGFTGGISFAPGTGAKERAAAGDVLGRTTGSPARRFRGGIAFAPGTGAKERSAASDTLGRVLGGF